MSPEAKDIVAKMIANPALMAELKTDPMRTLNQLGATDPEVIAELTTFATTQAAQAAQSKMSRDQSETTGVTADRFKEGLQDSLDQIRDGFKSTMLMYQVAFYLGAALIVLAAIFGATTGNSFIAVAFAGLGVLDFLVFFITKPPKDLERSRAELAKLNAAYFNWFIDIHNWNSYLALIGSQNDVDFQKMKEVSEVLFKNAELTLSMIEKHSSYRKAGRKGQGDSDAESA